MAPGDEIPIIRIEVDSLKRQIIGALLNHHDQIGAAIERQIREFDMDAYIKRSVEIELPRILDAQVKQAIDHVVTDALRSPEAWEPMSQMIINHLHKLVSNVELPSVILDKPKQ